MKIAFTGGGTGGHVFPAFAVIEYLKENGVQDIFWIGSKKGMEKKIVVEREIDYREIPAGKLRRYFSMENLVDVFKILGGFLSALRILKKERPDLLFSKGGYVSVPPVAAARLLNIPVFTHESDLDPGLATRINSKTAAGIFIPYEESRKFFSDALQDKLIVSGNPVRKAIFDGDPQKANEELFIPPDKLVVFFQGGSLGAMQINNLVEEIREKLEKECFIIHQTGSHHGERFEENYYSNSFFTDNFPHVLARADIVVSRAGAGSLWEIAVSGKPAILIPLGSSRGDQLRNADLFKERKAAIVLDPLKVTAEKLYNEITQLLKHADDRICLTQNVKNLCSRDAAKIIGDFILKEVGS